MGFKKNWVELVVMSYIKPLPSVTIDETKINRIPEMVHLCQVNLSA